MSTRSFSLKQFGEWSKRHAESSVPNLFATPWWRSRRLSHAMYGLKIALSFTAVVCLSNKLNPSKNHHQLRIHWRSGRLLDWHAQLSTQAILTIIIRIRLGGFVYVTWQWRPSFDAHPTSKASSSLYFIIICGFDDLFPPAFLRHSHGSTTELILRFGLTVIEKLGVPFSESLNQHKVSWREVNCLVVQCIELFEWSILARKFPLAATDKYCELARFRFGERSWRRFDLTYWHSERHPIASNALQTF